MKNIKVNKLKNLVIASFVLIFSACESIVDEEFLTNNTTVDNVELAATQTTAGGNEIVLSMLTPGVTGYWDYVLGKGLTDRVTITFPVTGTFEFKYVGTLGAEFFEKTISVTIETLDHPVAPEWAALLGDDAVAGKTWVYNQDLWAWWYMAAPDDPSGWAGVWWDANNCCAPGDANGKMHFDLNGGANYEHYESAGGSPTNTSLYELKPESMTLRITDGQNILGGYNDRGTSSAEYTIISLTADEMILFCNRTDAGDSGWTYIFKPE